MDLNQFKDKLDSSYSWPALYMFKFIVPAGMENEVIDIFPKHEILQKKSKNGKYISLTAKIMAGSSDQIIEIYQKATVIDGLISL